MRQFRWVSLIFTLGLLAAACQPAPMLAIPEGAALLADPQLIDELPANQGPVTEPSEAPTPGPKAVDECLNCHADKQKLVDTAMPEEPASESESKGVG